MSHLELAESAYLDDLLMNGAQSTDEKQLNLASAVLEAAVVCCFSRNGGYLFEVGDDPPTKSLLGRAEWNKKDHFWFN